MSDEGLELDPVSCALRERTPKASQLERGWLGESRLRTVLTPLNSLLSARRVGVGMWRCLSPTWAIRWGRAWLSHAPRMSQVLASFGVLIGAFALAYLLRVDLLVPPKELQSGPLQLPYVVLIQFAALALAGVYSLSMYPSMTDDEVDRVVSERCHRRKIFRWPSCQDLSDKCKL